MQRGVASKCRGVSRIAVHRGVAVQRGVASKCRGVSRIAVHRGVAVQRGVASQYRHTVCMCRGVSHRSVEGCHIAM